ncbi:MAG: hypothetical protein AW12_00590 [Candidatus Accumulibacter sp. BA-94]|nr:MAG: hypothetical protein AW12_00590 [Candidatus Accumulibacter sp. BA-94]
MLQRARQARILAPAAVGQQPLQVAGACRWQRVGRQVASDPFDVDRTERFLPGLRVLLGPAAEGRQRRQGGEADQPRIIAFEVVDHPLEQEVAEGHAAQAGLRVGDRVEDRRRRALCVEYRRVLVEQRLYVVGQAVDERHLDEDQWLHRHARVEEGVTAPVGIEPVLQIAPRTDLMHRLVLDQFLQQRCRRVPGDPLQFEKADVEPGAKP